VPRSAGVGRPNLPDAANFCDARMRAAFNVRASATLGLLKMFENGGSAIRARI
jgi:hypothetical protein